MAIYVKSDRPVHYACQEPGGRWVSKIGSFELIEHELDDLTGPGEHEYGNVAAVIGRNPRPQPEKAPSRRHEKPRAPFGFLAFAKDGSLEKSSFQLPPGVDRLEYHFEGRMHALGVPEHQVGMSDHKNHVEWRTFFPDEMTGGGNGPGSRINVDSGVMNLDLLVKDYNEHASKLWAASRLKDRIDAIISTAQAALTERAASCLPEEEWERLLVRIANPLECEVDPKNWTAGAVCLARPGRSGRTSCGWWTVSSRGSTGTPPTACGIPVLDASVRTRSSSISG